MIETISEYGIVKSKKKGFYYVSIEKSTKCGSCKICDFGSKNSITIPCVSAKEVNVGDKVVVENVQRKNYLSSFVLYFIPIIFIILGAIIANANTDNGLIVFASCFVGCIIGIFVVYVLDKVLRKNYMPRIKEVINEEVLF